MSKINEKAIAEMQRSLDMKLEDMKFQVAFPEVPEPEVDLKWRLYYAWGDSIIIRIPVHLEKARAYRDQLIAAGWDYDEKNSQPEKSVEKEMIFKFYQRGPDPVRKEFESRLYALKVQMVTWMDGGSCRKVKIGTQTVEQPIYEIVCNEGAEEEALDPPGFG